MFTGIVEEVGRVISAGGANLEVAAGLVLQGTELGSSIAVNGVCLTVTHFDEASFSVDLMPETRKRSTLGLLVVGDRVNLERPLAVGGRLGGHFVQGHIDTTGRVDAIRREGEALLLTFEPPPEMMRYVVEKGFIAVDGVSLTVVSRDTRSFQVSLVGYPRQHTTLGERRVGDPVNLEADIIAKYVEQLGPARQSGITIDLLKEHGFFTA